MQRIRKTLLAGLVGLALGSAGTAQAGFSFGDSNFSFGDDDDWWGPGWGNPYLGGPYGRPGWGDPRWGNGGTGRGWGPGYGPWGPGPYGMPPRLGSFDRTKMRLDRQRQMSNHDDAMEELGDMLYGRYNFDREKAIELAREIESGAGMALVRNFHPGSIATDESHTTPAFWTPAAPAMPPSAAPSGDNPRLCRPEAGTARMRKESPGKRLPGFFASGRDAGHTCSGQTEDIHAAES
ncbi:MAG: cytochrome c [Gammaproteobacteria bacterium]